MNNEIANTKKTSKTLAQGRKPGSGRKFEAAKFAINRAWEIARNAAVAHNTNPLNVAQKGLVKPTEFFAESLKIGWKEAKAKQVRSNVELYKLHPIPKKNKTTILNSIAMFIVANSLARTSSKDSVETIITKGAVASRNHKEALATKIFDARFTGASARSTNRHTLHAIAEVAETGLVPLEVQDKMAF
jgi:hypothetical protein